MTSCPCVDQPLAEVRAEEAGAAGDENAFDSGHGEGSGFGVQEGDEPGALATGGTWIYDLGFMSFDVSAGVQSAGVWTVDGFG